ncbi:MAG: hypothetical protein K9N35_01025 [Candidatus Marinimicrobia bacterium]|nr:hypothetical protein [Candidatus Neomarinimicrobiota bacterium]
MLLRNQSILMKLILITLGMSLVPICLFAQGYTPIFVSTDINEWDIDGRVTSQMLDTTLAFVFSFDEENPPLARPDTVVLDLANSIDLSACDSVFVKYSSAHNLPSDDSWVAGDVKVLVRNPYSPNWVEIYDENLSHLAGWVQNLDLRLKVAVRSNAESPGAFILYNIRVIGVCHP